MSDAPTLFPGTRWVIKPLVPDEVYTDRAEFLDYFYNAAFNAVGRRTMSTVLLGQRRMGKTEIFRRVVNRLFCDQDQRDPKAVVPVYYTFSDNEPDRRQFAVKYLENFIRYYVGFYTRQTEAILQNYAGDDSQTDIQMGWPVIYVHHRQRLPSGLGQEIDLLAAIGTERWVCQSKWVTTHKVGVAVVEALLTQAAAVHADFELSTVRCWLFAHAGLTAKAEALARQEGVLWSNREQLDGLLTYLGLRTLPTLAEVEQV